jgi:hypothetical protein
MTRRVLFVADQFADSARDRISRYPGGAELTDQAVIEASPWPVECVPIGKLNTRHLAEFDLHILGNLYFAKADQCEAFAKSGRHVLFEHDYRVCRWRGAFGEAKSLYHRRFWRCNCRPRKWARALQTALGAIFLTHRQLAVYRTNPFMRLPQHIVLGCSVMGSPFFEAVQKFRQAGSPRGTGTVVIYSGHATKGYQQALDFCHAQGIEPRVVRDASPAQLLAELARAEQLVFLPQWPEPASRLAIEARFLGCNLISNDVLGVAGEAWWHMPDDAAFEVVRDAPARFWRAVEALRSSKGAAKYSWTRGAREAKIVYDASGVVPPAS